MDMVPIRELAKTYESMCRCVKKPFRQALGLRKVSPLFTDNPRRDIIGNPYSARRIVMR
jgi:hypothetical protein